MFSRRTLLCGLALSGTSRVLATSKATVLPPTQPEPLASEPFSTGAPWAEKLIAAAESQIGRTLCYNGSYVRLDYPIGDVPIAAGVCTDVVIRAYRTAFAIDLQKTVHEDMTRAFAKYPSVWGFTRPDRNIDHRRVLNLERFFARKGADLPITKQAQDYQPGDLVSQRLPGNLPHIAIVTHRPSADGLRPLVAHNIGAGTRLEDSLFNFTITGHFRFPPAGR